jgi:uncharacterized protein with HEPN domain
MSERDDEVYLWHMLEAAEQITSYRSSVDEQTFVATRMLQDAVVRQLEIIGEAAKNLSSRVRDANPSIRWKDIAGMRDKLIHQYFGVDLRIVWDTALRDVPLLKAELARILGS